MSLKSETSVALIATRSDDYLRLAIAAENFSDAPALIDPQAIRVLTVEDGWYEFMELYAPSEAAGELSSDSRWAAIGSALGSVGAAMDGNVVATELHQANAHRRAQEAAHVETQVQASVLRKNTIWPGQMIYGVVYGDFPGFDRLTVTVPVGNEEHVFSYVFSK